MPFASAARLARHLAASGARFAPPAAARPLVYAALGDSITRASGSAGWGDAPHHSWATGAGESVAARLAGALAPRPVEALNLARSGARVIDLEAQARRATAAGADLVTVLLGGNDALLPDLDEGAFRASVRHGLAALPASATVLVFALPDVARLAQVLAAAPRALGALAAYGIPVELVAALLAERTACLNTVLEEEARRAGAGWSGVTAKATFGREHVSAWDDFHPSLEGQRRLAELAWPPVEALLLRADAPACRSGPRE